MSLPRLFFLSIVVSTLAVSGWYYLTQHERVPAVPQLVQIADGVFITSQLGPRSISSLNGRGIKTIVDIRPDGEAPGQASAAQIEAVSKDQGIGFHYVPVPHESIPDGAVTAVSEVLAHRQGPTLLYCRTGRRAVRTVALAQASQADGPNTEAIFKMVKEAGFSADDLKDQITQRIARRPPAPGAGH